MKRVKLLLFAVSPFIISLLFSYVLLELELVGMEISFMSIIFCIYWLFVGYKSYGYVTSTKESILLGNSFAIISIILIILQIALMGRYMLNIIGSAPQSFFLPMVRVSSWISSLIYSFIRFTSTSITRGIISFILMLFIYYIGYSYAKAINEGK